MKCCAGSNRQLEQAATIGDPKAHIVRIVVDSPDAGLDQGGRSETDFLFGYQICHDNTLVLR